MPKKREERDGWHWEGDDFVENTSEWEAQQREEAVSEPVDNATEFIHKLNYYYRREAYDKRKIDDLSRNEVNDLYKQIRQDAANGDPLARGLYDWLTKGGGDPIVTRGDARRYPNNPRYNIQAWDEGNPDLRGLPSDLPSDFNELPPPDEPPPSAPVRPDPTPYGPMAPPGPPNWRKRHGPQRRR